MRPDTLGVLGLGAIGGSVAWQAARAGTSRILGYSTDAKDGAAALRAGAVTDLVRTPRAVVQQADLIVIAAPPQATLALLGEIAPAAATRENLITDVASVKAPVIAAARALGMATRFAGSHPFAGTHVAGFAGARPDRFREMIVYVTPVAGGERAADEIADFWTRVFEAHPVQLDAERHDELLAFTSHLPQAVAAALAVTLAKEAPSGARFGTGARSTTRLAASSAEMWADVLLLNREPVLAALGRFGASVASLVTALERGDGNAVRVWLDGGAAWRRGLAP